MFSHVAHTFRELDLMAIVQLTSSRVIDKMVVDEGRALQPCRYRLFTHMSCIILYPYSTQPCRGYTHVITNTGGNNY